MTPHLHGRYVEGCYRCELNKDEVRSAMAEVAADILEAEAWFNGLDPSMKDALSLPNHEMQQAERAVDLARLVQAVHATPDTPAQVTDVGRTNEGAS